MRRRAAIQLKRADDLALSLQASSSPLSAQQQSVASASIAATLSTDGQPLDEATRAFMEPHFGYDFSQVRIFADDQAAETAAALHAQAYTVGNNIVFGDGQYTPGTPEGQRLIAHEVAHVIQQSQGPVAGRSFGDGLTISDPADAEEQAADQTANHIERSRSSQDTNPPLSSSLHAVNPPSDSETEQLPEENEHSGTDAVLEGAGRATPFIIQRKKIDAPPPNDDDLLSRRFQARQPNHDFTVLPVYAADIDSAIGESLPTNQPWQLGKLTPTTPLTIQRKVPDSASPDDEELQRHLQEEQGKSQNGTVSDNGAAPHTNVLPIPASVDDITPPKNISPKSVDANMMGELGNGVIAPTTPVPSLSEDKGKEAVSTPDSLPKTEAGTAQPIQDKTSGNELSEQNKDKDNLQQTSLTGASQDASTSTVARAPGDALSYQVATPNDNGVVAVAPQVSNPSLLAENPDGTTLDVLQDNKALEQFIERIKAQQQEIDQLAVKQKEEIQAKAETQKQALLQSTETQISQLEQVRAQTLQQITQSAAQNRSHIITQRDNEIQAVNSATDTELASLEQTVIKHQSEVRQAAADNANTARSKGEQEAARAISNCTAKASMAMSLGASKAAAYTKSKRYPDIFEAAMQIANDAAQQIRAAGSKMADTAKNDANKLAAKFVKEGEQVASSFLKSQDTGKLHIHQSCLETIQKITIKAAENLTHIDTAEQTAANQLTSKCSDISQQLRQSAQQILPDIDEQAKNACLKVDETSNQTKSALDQFIQQVQGQFGNYPDELIEENLAAADNEISSILKGYEDGLNQIGNDTESSIQETINQKVEQIATQATQITEIIQQVGLDFEAQATNISSSFTQQASEAASKSKESMLAIVTGVDKNLAQSVKESTAKWTEQLTQGIGEIKKKIVEGLAQQDKVLDAKEANRLENESLLDRSKAAVGYLIGGFLSEAREFINSIGGILKNSLPVLISVLAIVTVITILALLAPAIVLPIIFGLFVVLEFIFDVAAICFFASASVGFLSAIYVVFFSGQSLSDRERWDMLGRSVFNVSLAYIGVVAAVTRVFGLFKTVGTLGRLLTMVKSPFELIGLLLKAGSVKRLETLLVLVGDSKRLSSLLKYYGDAKKFEAALQAVGNNVDELEKMINQAGGDLSKAREILGSGTRSPRLLENNIGQWKAANESMSPPARDYQQQITGRSGEVYLVDGVKFDGFKSGVLLEAKGPGYADFIENGKFEPWFRGKDAILKQAENQIQVAKDTHIEWHVAEKEAANAIKSLFEKEGFERIEVIYTPTN